MTELAWRLTRLGGRSALLSTGLTALAVAVATLLLQFAVAGNFAFDQRGDRTAWRDPGEADGAASAVIATAADHFGGDTITRVDLASLGGAPVPPGLDAFPAPGEVWLSPAAADLLEGVPESDFLARYGDVAVAGELGGEALAHPNELVAVVGRSADDPVMTTERFNADAVSPRGFDSFAGGAADAVYGFYMILMVLAAILMAVPAAVFGAASARLTVSRRDERLATLRLIGATPGQVMRLTLIETVLAAAAGAVAGTIAWMLVTPLVALIPIDGGRWYVADLWAGAPWMTAVALAVPVLVAVSALIGLRGVVISPLGVARRVKPKGLKAIRVVVFVVLAVLFLAATQAVSGSMLAVGILVVLFAATLAAVNLIGPWTVQKLGNVLARTARGPARLLAARRLAEDPKAAWRAVAGVAIAGFIAGSVALFPMIVTDTSTRETETIAAMVPEGEAEALAAVLGERLGDGAGVAVVDSSGYLTAVDGAAVVEATTTGAELEAVRSAMTAVLPGDPPEREVDSSIVSNRLVGSIRVGVTVVLAVVFATAAVSAAISAIGSVLDRRQAYRLLHLAGTPQQVLDRARRQEALLPLGLLGGASILTGMLLTAPVIGAMGFDASGALILGATVALGFGAVVAAGAVSRPLLRSVMQDVSPRPD
ncbi:FtsX-like permease family protein [Glycomyces harbinensis]|uniref:FtsX-like permease family protein n=1 Tax=Glycomyces harbinensis TaxID=58114 RepID=A0A1G6YS44_9ACTN|nr:FtsX-like permease family protein [Glycomyces harbinensis]SDD93229.1 FtsX-like permease family protein [Glycomyces harbinensis]